MGLMIITLIHSNLVRMVHLELNDQKPIYGLHKLIIEVVTPVGYLYSETEWINITVTNHQILNEDQNIHRLDQNGLLL